MAMASSRSTSHEWGGRRPGAGRKRTTEEPLFAREVRLTMPQMAFVSRYGQGRFIDGLRRLIDEAWARDQAAPPTPDPAPTSASLADPPSHR